ncbi:MAG TPA: hypothetical protein VFD03_01215 [Clostridia bacterium]|nr:hypothetical protein [Clostridia bacterium]
MKIKDRFLSGHIKLGRLTLYGRNAMNWGCNIYTKKYGYICFRLPLTCFGKWHPLYLYFSPNGTPWASTFMIGKKHDTGDYALSRVRKYILGHNFFYDSENDINGNYERLQRINRSI